MNDAEDGEQVVVKLDHHAWTHLCGGNHERKYSLLDVSIVTADRTIILANVGLSEPNGGLKSSNL
jgi:hypothetical protein